MRQVRNKLRRLWRLAVATHPINASKLSKSCGFRGAGPISRNPLQAPKDAYPTAALLRSLQWVSDGYVSPRDTALIGVCYGRVRGGSQN